MWHPWWHGRAVKVNVHHDDGAMLFFALWLRFSPLRHLHTAHYQRQLPHTRTTKTGGAKKQARKKLKKNAELAEKNWPTSAVDLRGVRAAQLAKLCV